VDTSRISRRELLRLAGGAAGLSAVAAACSFSSAPSDYIDWASWWSRRRRSGQLDFANWPYYIDRRRDDSHPSLERFTKRTGIEVTYYRPIKNNASFLSRIEPALRGHLPTGYDLMVITNGPELSELIERDWLIPLDHTRLPTFAREASPTVRDPYWDPDNRYSVAWQSGLTGIAYRPEAVDALGREPDSLADLFERALFDRVGMLSDLLDLGSAGLLAAGLEPSSSTESDWQEAARLLTEQRDRGLVRRYYDQGYIGALQRGDTWISQAWSGDIYQVNRLGHPELRFVVPSEGVVFWTDNMVIPRGAEHPVDAIELMDFVYRPEIAALIADWVWYICPVPAAKPIVARELGDPATARSPLVFPNADILGERVSTASGDLYVGSPLRFYPRLDSAAERRTWARTFGAIVSGA
jgi:spermidine/putrescine transport system substrate-binding protein